MIRALILVFTLIIVAAGCKTKSKTITDRGPVPERSQEELLHALKEHNYDFTWFAGEANIKVVSPIENVSAKTYLRIKKDSVIWAVVKKVGVEGGRILVTPNLYASIDRLNGTYSRGQTNDVLSQMGIDFDFFDAQQAVYGNIILPDTLEALNVSKKDDLYKIEYPQYDLTINYWVNAYDLKLVRVLLSDKNGRSIDVSFDNYKNVQDLSDFSFQRKYIIDDPVNGKVLINMDYKKVWLDTPKSTKFTIPPHYQEVD